jgi:archaellum component FlaF (FlaF/FlaG flagellin family)
MKRIFIFLFISFCYYYTAYNNKNEIIKQNNPVASDKATIYVGLIFI